MKKKKKWVAIAVALVVLGGVGFAAANAAGQAALAALPAVSTTALERRDLVSSISVKGTVESNHKHNVYSTLSFTVKSIPVEVGDAVTAGQTLCVLDTADVEQSIAQQRAEISVAKKSSENTVENNARILAEAEKNIDKGVNSQLVSARSSLKTAEANYESQRLTAEQNVKNAQKTYDDALRELNERTNINVLTAENALLGAQTDYNIKANAYGLNQNKFRAGDIKEVELNTSETAFLTAQTKLNDSTLQLQKAEKAVRDAVDTAKTQLDTALQNQENTLKTTQTALDNARSSYSAARTAADQDLERSRNSVTSAQIQSSTESREIALAKLEKQLKDATITAPASGTVTAVFAKQGASGSGLLFVIEDTASLKVVTRVKEYDVGRVSPGMEVLIKADGTGDAEYLGRLSRIDPAAVKSANGDTASASDIEFGAEVQVTSPETALRIGLSSRLTIILERTPSAFSVPYDAVTGAEGEKAVFVAADENGAVVARRVPVTTGAETDFYVEIAGTGLSEGLRVISDPTGVTEGRPVRLK